MKLEMEYSFNGNINSTLKLVAVGDDIDLLTENDELITSVRTGYGMMKVIDDLLNNRFKKGKG